MASCCPPPAVTPISTPSQLSSCRNEHTNYTTPYPHAKNTSHIPTFNTRQQAAEGDKPALVSQADSVASGLNAQRYTAGHAYYSKVMQNVVKKGSDYPKTELARLTKVIDSGSVAASKMTDFLLRLNVLAAFIPTDSA
jgi:hypothetical protein